MKIYLADIRDLEAYPDLIEQYQGLLVPIEQKRYHKITDLNRRNQFLLGRALIQDICHQSPTLSKNGKPLITKGFISLAHSGPYVVLGVSDTPMGIDIEDMTKTKDFDELAQRLNFNLSENKRLSFYQQFTLSEARYKQGDELAKTTIKYYYIDTFIICIITLYNNKNIEFIKTIPFKEQHPVPLSEDPGV